MLAIQESLPTRGHPRAQVCCAQCCQWVRDVLHLRAGQIPSAPQGSLRRLALALVERDLIGGAGATLADLA